MPLTTQAVTGAGATGPAMKGPLGASAHAEVSNAIGQLTAANAFGSPGTIIKDVFGWRVDRQNAPGDMVNISVQKNGIDSPSTVASVFVPGAFNVGKPAIGSPNHAAQLVAHGARMKELERAMRRGLEQSFATFKVDNAKTNTWAITRFQVGGTFSA